MNNLVTVPEAEQMAAPRENCLSDPALARCSSIVPLKILVSDERRHRRHCASYRRYPDRLRRLERDRFESSPLTSCRHAIVVRRADSSAHKHVIRQLPVTRGGLDHDVRMDHNPSPAFRRSLEKDTSDILSPDYALEEQV